MSNTDETPLDTRVEDLETDLRNTKKQVEMLTEQLMGTLTILCLPMPTGKKLEFGFKMLEKLPNHILKVIVKRYVSESKFIDLKFDEMVDPMYRTFGFERLWKILDGETIREVYGEWSLARWQEMAKTHQCED